jgi:hypothetical protein
MKITITFHGSNPSAVMEAAIKTAKTSGGTRVGLGQVTCDIPGLAKVVSVSTFQPVTAELAFGDTVAAAPVAAPTTAPVAAPVAPAASSSLKKVVEKAFGKAKKK